MINLSIDNYLGKSSANEKIMNILEEKKLVYMIAGCGIGKTYWIKNYLMNKEKVLNVNFLNVLNEQNFSDSFVQGDRGAKELDGTKSATINVQNLKFVSVLFDVLVIDEIQKASPDSSYRDCCKDIPEVIKKYKEAGKKVIVVTGTPADTKIYEDFGFEFIKVERTNIEVKDRYEFIFVKGLNKRNLPRVIEERLDFGVEGLIVISNRDRDRLGRNLYRGGYSYEELRSDLRQKEGTLKNLIKGTTDEEGNIHYYLLKENSDNNIFLSTSVMIEGLNVEDTNKIEVITWLNEIKNPQNIIQSAGRMRAQKKIIYIGYSSDEEFNYSTKRIVRNTTDINDFLALNEEWMSNNFNSFEDWKNYLETYTNCKVKKNSIEDFSEVNIEISKESKQKTDWSLWCKKATEVYKSSKKPIVAKRIEAVSNEEGCFRFEVAPNGNSNWAYVTEPEKAKLLFNLLECGFNISDLKEDEIKYSTKVMKYSKVLLTAIREGILMDEDAVWGDLVGELITDKLNEEHWNRVIRKTFDFTYILDGVKVDVSDPRIAADYEKKTKTMIDEPTVIVNNFKKTVLEILTVKLGRNLEAIDRRVKDYSISWLDAMFINMDMVFTTDLKNYNQFLNSKKKANKGLSINYKFALMSDLNIKFKTASDCFKYYSENNLGKQGENTFKKKDIKTFFNKVR